MTQVPYTFGTESGPIPLSQLDANFAVTPQYATTAGNVVNARQANITSLGTLTVLSVVGNVTSGNLRTTGFVSASGNITAGNVATVGNISAYGTVVGGNFITTGNITSGNISTDTLSVGLFEITELGQVLYFSYYGTKIAKLDTAGNFTVKGNVTSLGNI